MDRLQTILRQEDAAALEGFIVNELYQRIDPVSEACGRLMEVQLDVAEAEYLLGTQEYARMRVAFIVIMAVALIFGILLPWNRPPRAWKS
ncbi:hypothetical protein L861_15235 [Litchfieldella anticariensis FP35 = DSM 16096]|uniref:Uncharacterized protein n=1 Tax=Litchfieldella anticariensis (strain DSM 16096 / CECT 5854 / CIP 108499 / LMG 22089 / FP35) TaxID=1121939 RepID=S2KPK6_LITA3|nr:hypothetical protein [Halomonas anticariensis]EPC02388.1 hypothetical protein L861_15235 [Halomonas anticariensis FP35 = DSM 16096]